MITHKILHIFCVYTRWNCQNNYVVIFTFDQLHPLACFVVVCTLISAFEVFSIRVFFSVDVDFSSNELTRVSNRLGSRNEKQTTRVRVRSLWPDKWFLTLKYKVSHSYESKPKRLMWQGFCISNWDTLHAC